MPDDTLRRVAVVHQMCRDRARRAEDRGADAVMVAYCDIARELERVLAEQPAPESPASEGAGDECEEMMVYFCNLSRTHEGLCSFDMAVQRMNDSSAAYRDGQRAGLEMAAACADEEAARNPAPASKVAARTIARELRAAREKLS